MGSRISNGVWNIVMWQKKVGFSFGKGKMKNPHTGQPEFIAKLDHIRGNHPQILGDDRQIGKALLQCVEQLFPGNWHPFPADGVGSICGYLPIGGEAAEMVDTHEISKV